MTPNERLRYPVTGAIERGEAEAIVEQRATPNVTEQLEALIDATSLLDVLTGLELVCAEKAAIIREIGPYDRLTARHWDQASGIMNNAVNRISHTL